MNWLPRLLLILCLSAAVGCQEQTIDRDQLVERDGLFYEKFSTEPFTGKVTGKTVGRMSEGLFKGLVSVFDEDGQLSAQMVQKGGVLHGEYSEFFPNGQLQKRGQLKNDLQDGLWELFSESGVMLAAMSFEDGKLHGLVTHYRETGVVESSQEFKNNVEHGEYREYWESGKLEQRGMYRGGVKFGKWEFLDEEGKHSHLQLAVENVVSSELENGESATFHHNGFVESAGLRSNGLKDGVWSFYDKNGELIRTVEYEDGIEVNPSE